MNLKRIAKLISGQQSDEVTRKRSELEVRLRELTAAAKARFDSGGR